MQDLKVSICQAKLFWEDKDQNLSMFTEMVEQEAGRTDVVVLPEMFTTGFSMKPEEHYETENGRALNWMKETSSKLDAVVTGSVIIREEGKYYNRLYWVQPDGKFFKYDKKHLFTMVKENDHYSPGSRKLIVEWKGWKICPMVCFDLRFPVWIRNAEGYDCALFVANWPEKRVAHWKNLLVARAIENQSFVVGVNRVGDDGNGIAHSGDSMIVSPVGEKLIHLKSIEHVARISLSYNLIKKTRRYMPFLTERDSFSLD